MYFSSILAAFLAATSTSIAAVQTNNATLPLTESDESPTPVHITATCVGADLSKLSFSTGFFVGNVLQATYNEIINDDDSELSDVSFTSDRGRRRAPFKAGFWKGGWGCDVCTKDIGTETKEWAKLFAARLVASDDATFRSIKSCSINVDVAARSKSNDDVVVDVPNVNIQVRCGAGVDMSSLTVGQGTFLARSVQNTYSKVHGDVDPNNSLDKLVYSAGSKMSNVLTGVMSICRLCPRDDDLTYGIVDQSGSRLDDWQTELAVTLRQSNVKTFRKISKCKIKVTPLSATTALESSVEMEMIDDEDDEPLTPVGVVARCAGADFSKLSFSSGAFVGNLLQDSYNEVVDNDEADDSELSDVTFARRPRRLKAKSGFWTGNWGCYLCTKDSSAETKLWGQAFAASLLASGDEAFRSVKSCTIEMAVASRTNDDGVTPNVDIQVHCGKNLDVNSLSVAQGTYLAHAVQRSYGKAHDAIDKDNSSLDHVIYSATAASANIAASSPSSSSGAEMSLTRRRRKSYSMLGFIIGDCSRERPCPNDDLMYGTAAIQGFLGSAALVAWQNDLVAALRESNFKTFRKVTKCTIKMLPVKVVEVEDMADETSPVMESTRDGGGVRGGCALAA